MTRKEQILKIAEFDEGLVISQSAPHTKGNEAAWLYSIRDAYAENSRLKPLITALAERVEMLEGALRANKKIWDFYSEFETLDGVNSDEDLLHIAITLTNALTTPSALDALLKGEG